LLASPFNWPMHAVYAGAWLSFGIAHSILCQPRVKLWAAPQLGRAYRLVYNGVSLVHIGVVLGLGRALIAPVDFSLPTALLGIHLVGWVVFLMALKDYDLSRFSGMAQWRGVGSDDDENFVTNGFHRYVRHPLYLGAVMMLWGGVRDDLGFATALWASLYFAIGTVFEERKLAGLYGQAYLDYKARVPAIVPWKGRVPL
jgi:protein-S-isoprenylcysteine O-methyltransferase Ste14